MTGYTVHTGTSKKFVSGWDRVFGESTDDAKAKKSKGKKTKKKPAGKQKKKS